MDVKDSFWETLLKFVRRSLMGMASITENKGQSSIVSEKWKNFESYFFKPPKKESFWVQGFFLRNDFLEV